jgi:O-antigen/teichoic acid export membrane protein
MSEQWSASKIRESSLRGGIHLTLRQAAGMGVSLIGSMGTMAVLGPKNYGIWVCILQVFSFCSVLSDWGAVPFLLKCPGVLSHEILDRCHTFTVCLGAAAFVLYLAASIIGTAMGMAWEQILLAGALFAWLPFQRALGMRRVQLERDMRYRELSIIEIQQQILLYIIALPAISAGLGLWGMAAGWWIQNLFGWVVISAKVRHRFCWTWDTGFFRKQMVFGFGSNLVNLTSQLRWSIYPLLVGLFAGAEAVGVIRLAQRLVEFACFSQPIFGRILQSACPKLADQGNGGGFIRKAVLLQTALSAVMLWGLNLLGPVIVPLFLGKAWQNALLFLPPLSIAAFLNTPISVLWQCLWAKAAYPHMITGNTIRAILLIAGTAILFPLFGAAGYVWAEVLNAAISLVVLLCIRWLPSEWVPVKLLVGLGAGAVCLLNVRLSSPILVTLLLLYRRDLWQRVRGLMVEV